MNQRPLDSQSDSLPTVLSSLASKDSVRYGIREISMQDFIFLCQKIDSTCIFCRYVIIKHADVSEVIFLNR